jgi:hemoglobin
MQSDGFIASEGNIICVDELDVYAMVGEEGFARLIAAFYQQVPGDAILGPMYPPDDLAGAEQRLRDFLVGRFGGPQRYVEQRGHPRLRMRHMPFAVTAAARERWLQLMGNALTAAQFPPDADAFLREFFAGVSEMLINRQE